MQTYCTTSDTSFYRRKGQLRYSSISERPILEAAISSFPMILLLPAAFYKLFRCCSMLRFPRDRFQLYFDKPTHCKSENRQIYRALYRIIAEVPICRAKLYYLPINSWKQMLWNALLSDRLRIIRITDNIFFVWAKVSHIPFIAKELHGYSSQLNWDTRDLFAYYILLSGQSTELSGWNRWCGTFSQHGLIRRIFSWSFVVLLLDRYSNFLYCRH